MNIFYFSEKNEKMKYPSIDEKFNIVISKNTFYFYNPSYEEYYEGHISSIAQNIFLLKNKIETSGLKESVLFEHITKVEDGIDALLTITGFSKESLQRLVTFIRVTNDTALSKLVNKEAWPSDDFTTEWNLGKIKQKIRRRYCESIL